MSQITQQRSSQAIQDLPKKSQFDGSVFAERTAGEVSARCHDEHANVPALNLMHDIVTRAETVQETRDYHAKEFAGVRVLSDEDLEKAVAEGKERG